MLCRMFDQRCFSSARNTAIFHKVSEASGRLEVQSRSLGSIPRQTKLYRSSVYYMNYSSYTSVLVHIIYRILSYSYKTTILNNIVCTYCYVILTEAN